MRPIRDETATLEKFLSWPNAISAFKRIFPIAIETAITTEITFWITVNVIHRKIRQTNSLESHLDQVLVGQIAATFSYSQIAEKPVHLTLYSKGIDHCSVATYQVSVIPL